MFTWSHEVDDVVLKLSLFNIKSTGPIQRDM